MANLAPHTFSHFCSFATTNEKRSKDSNISQEDEMRPLRVRGAQPASPWTWTRTPSGMTPPTPATTKVSAWSDSISRRTSRVHHFNRVISVSQNGIIPFVHAILCVNSTDTLDTNAAMVLPSPFQHFEHSMRFVMAGETAQTKTSMTFLSLL